MDLIRADRLCTLLSVSIATQAPARRQGNGFGSETVNYICGRCSHLMETATIITPPGRRRLLAERTQRRWQSRAAVTFQLLSLARRRPSARPHLIRRPGGRRWQAFGRAPSRSAMRIHAYFVLVSPPTKRVVFLALRFSHGELDFLDFHPRTSR